MPRISVIIPIHDVEPCLPTCLESVAAQTWEDIEVVMVDDGAPDSSAEVAAGFADRDGRFRLVRQANLGPGAARDTGVRHASGEFLAFAAAADLLPPYALEYQLASLLRSGSDLATGNVHRYGGRRSRPSAAFKAIFSGMSEGATTHLTRASVLMRDSLVTNKLWRRSFWDEHGFRFPHGASCGDVLVAVRGHALAGTVDVLPAPVRLRRRQAGAHRSGVQEQTRAGHLDERFAAVRSVREFLAASGLAAHIPSWDHAVLDGDLTAFIDCMDRAPEAFRARFLDLACTYLGEVAPSVLTRLPALRRLEWHLVALRRADDLAEVVAWDRDAGRGERTVSRLGRSYLASPLLGRRDPAVPGALSRVRETPRHRIDAVRWQDGRLVVEGRLLMEGGTGARHAIRPLVFASLVHESTEPVKTTRHVRVAASSWRVPGEGGRGGFRLTVDPRRLGGAADAGVWRLEMRVAHRGGITRSSPDGARSETAAQAGARAAGPGRHVVPELTEGGRLILRVERERARVVRQSLWGGRLRLEGEAVEQGTGLGREPVLLVTREPGGVPLPFPMTTDGRTFTTEIDLRDILPARRTAAGVPDVPTRWRVDVRSADGVVTPVTVSDDLPDGRHGLAGREIVAARDRSGRLVLRDQTAAAFVDLAEWLPGGELLVEGGFAEPYQVSALVVRSRGGAAKRATMVRLARAEGSGTRFRARLTPEAVDAPAGRLPLPRGRYGLAVRAEGVHRDLPIEFAPDFALVHETACRTFTLGGDGDGHAVLTVSGDLGGDERGVRAQRELRGHVYPAMRDRPLWPAVFFDCEGGTGFRGCPRAIYQELRRRGADLTFLWNVHDGQVALPGDVEAVRTRGRDYYEALARCRYIVSDGHLPAWFERRSGQTVLQTWHGSPLEAGTRRRVRRAEQWSHLLSAGPWWTPRLREMFGFRGEVMETGLPRNDILRASGRDAVAARVRRRLGVPDEVRLVLYVPDGEQTLDLGRVAAALRDAPVLLAEVGRATAPGVIGVSAQCDPHELYLAADALATGYSPAVFDFAVTGRPMLFHTGGRTRTGLHLDFEAEAPGPLLHTAGDVAEAIGNLDEVADKHAGMLEAFVARYCPLDDGEAAARVADRLLAR
ncbi:hypothetical protein Pth03_15090 [Planotetraspora thailandica]|uniref:Glycosyltransferase 2-like domain-containing protein n=1 Tax=Planotetraspora thailandica TaxID=487172 RepID=A0A8J3XUH7_9ACTN|nr:CDP-glycerol glycerophosphotransferase family protein [Planotetraspora thailandica]GII53120.1 hypothetical protein Pth03_15090 [Planotetraspora thailandica]